jgi:LPXTG-motif cell wall-anchored protein
MVEPDEPEDLPGDGTEGDAPAAEVETTTPEPSDEATVPAQPDEPADTPDEPSLPFTGGNSTPFVLVGLIMALAGVGVLIARRQVFNR